MLSLPRRVALSAALAIIFALAASSGAGATVAPPVQVGPLLTVNGDDADDVITLSTAGGVIVVNGTPTNLAANTNAEIVVEAGGGEDIVDVSALGAGYGKLTLAGGAGNDHLTGGSRDDLLHGDGGNDRLLGFRGEDTVFGDEGDDLMVWNPADASDHNDGGGGTDEVEVNGSPTANDEFSVGVEAGRVLFHRDSGVAFDIDFTAERLTVNALGGNDVFEPGGVAITALGALTSVTLNGGGGSDVLLGADGGDRINGGTGFDALIGGGGADVLSGGDDADSVDGNSGADRVIGDRGPDALIGDEGNDTLVWNNGDGSDDIVEGDAGFDRVEVNGSPAAGDEFSLTPAGPGLGATFARTNLVPFTLPIALDNEVIAVDGGDGNDAFTVQPDVTALLVVANGGAGDDALTGAEEADSLFGGSGNDSLSGGRGSDLLDGEEGNDRLLARDEAGDLVRGGNGSDSAQTDRVTVDAIDGVETLDATPPPAEGEGPAQDQRALLPTLGKFKLVGSHNRLAARTRVGCPAAETGGCRVTIALETARAIRLAGIRAVLVLGSTSAKLRPGQAKMLSVPLVGGAGTLAKRGKLGLHVALQSVDASGNSAAKSSATTLRVPTLSHP